MKSKISKTALILFFSAIFLFSGPNEVSANTASLQCASGVNPSVTVNWGDWGDWDRGRPTQYELYKRTSSQSGLGTRVANFSFAGKRAFYKQNYSDSSVSNGTNYRYTVRRRNGNGSYSTAIIDSNVKCGKAVNVSIFGAPNVSWRINGGSVNNGSGTGGGTAYVRDGGSYSISFTPPSGYAMISNYPRIRNLQGPYNDTYGVYSFTANTDKSIQGYFVRRVNAPSATLLCQKNTGISNYNGKFVRMVPKFIVNWSATSGATGYRVNNTRKNNSQVDAGNTRSHTYNAFWGDNGAFTVEPYNSSGSMGVSSTSSTISADCTATINVSANVDGGSWEIRNNIGHTSRNDVVRTGSGTSASHSLLGATVYSISPSITATPSPGYRLVRISPSWIPWMRTGNSYDVSIEWEQSPPPTPSLSASCNGGNPEVAVVWRNRLADGESTVVRSPSGLNPSNPTSAWYGGRSGNIPPNTWTTYTYVDDTPQAENTYTYWLERNGLQSSQQQVYVPSCGPTTASVAVNSNLASAEWDLYLGGSRVLNDRTGDHTYTANLGVGGSSSFRVEAEDVDGYTLSVSNSQGGSDEMSSISSGDSESFTLTYTADPSVDIGASPNPVNYGESVVLTWSSENVDTCTASGAWSGSKATSGSQTMVNVTSESIYTLTCDGESQASDTVNVTVFTPTRECNDSVDNDGDGQTDHPNDPDCTSVVDDSEGVAQCNDGLDNDSDGYTDLDDPDCDNGEDNAESGTIGIGECSDTVDNDGDGDIDLDDVHCTGPGDDEEAAVPNFGLQKVGDLDVTGTGSWLGDMVIFVAPENGFNSDVSLSVISHDPALAAENAEYDFDDGTLDSSEYDDGSGLEIRINGNLPNSGSYPVTIQGSGGGLNRTLQVFATVSADGDVIFEEF